MEKQIKDRYIIMVMVGYNYKKGAESAIQVVRDKLRQYAYVTPFDDKIVRSDKFWGLGGEAASKLAKDTRESIFNARILKTDAEIIEWLTHLYKRISQSKKADPDFYAKAKQYLGQISEVSKYIQELGPKEDRRAVGQGIHELLNKMEGDCELKPLGESKTLTERVYSKLEEKQKAETKEEQKKAREKGTAEEKKTKERAYDSLLKDIKEAAKKGGVTEDEVVAQLGSNYAQRKVFILTYDANKNNKTYEKQRKGIKKMADEHGLSEEELIERIKAETELMEEFLSRYNKGKITKK